MLKYKWVSKTLYTNAAANRMVKLFQEHQPKIGAIDTETDGLHIILSKPFVVQFGWLHPTELLGYTFAVELEQTPDLARQVINWWLEAAKSLDLHMGHNIKFDLHMLTNAGFQFHGDNLTDTMFYIRYGHDALTAANGGPPLGLKEYTTRYLDPTAKHHEKLLSKGRSALAKEYNLALKQRLAACGKPPEKYKAKSYTLSVIDDLFKDPVFSSQDLPDKVREAYLDWLHLDLPLQLQKKVTSIVTSDMIPYTWLDRQTLLDYAHKDIVYTLELWAQLDPIVKARGNEEGLRIENSLILPLFEMERVGFAADIPYLQDSKRRLKEYILQRREELLSMVEEVFTIGQHARIKTLLLGFGVEVPSTGSEYLDQVKADLIRSGESEEAVRFIGLIQELRTLEKWYSAYITRFLRDLQDTDRLYTTINQVGTVSGRVTSDFQQFPKDPIVTADGEELFYPRKMVKTSGGGYNALVYIDYSQIELRFQALYTILVGHPDLNLCRAYMPFQCVDEMGELFDCHNPSHIVRWAERWYLSEDRSVLWEPVDVHGATTTAATGLGPGDPEFKHLRSVIGKRVNFAKNYGAKYNKIKTMFPDKTEEEVKRIDDAYYTAFPGVKQYHEYCYASAQMCAYTPNLFGIRYYGVNGHKLINLLVQGSAAYYLKLKIRELYDYSKAHNLKTRWQMQIHDELSWERWEDETDIFYEFKRIMEDWPDALVPIVAEMDVSTTTWADKKGVDDIEQLRLRLSL